MLTGFKLQDFNDPFHLNIIQPITAVKTVALIQVCMDSMYGCGWCCLCTEPGLLFSPVSTLYAKLSEILVLAQNPTTNVFVEWILLSTAARKQSAKCWTIPYNIKIARLVYTVHVLYNTQYDTMPMLLPCSVAVPGDILQSSLMHLRTWYYTEHNKRDSVCCDVYLSHLWRVKLWGCHCGPAPPVNTTLLWLHFDLKDRRINTRSLVSNWVTLRCYGRR